MAEKKSKKSKKTPKNKKDKGKAKKEGEKKSKSKEEVCETFEIEKSGKKDKKTEEVKTVCGSVEKKKASKSEVKRYNKILKNVLIVLGVIILLIFVLLYLMNSSKYFEYRGVEGEMVQEGELFFYKITFPVVMDGKNIDYNIYIRNNPEKLGKEIPFVFNTEDEIDFGQRFASDNQYRLVLNTTKTEKAFECSESQKGHAVISVANMINLKVLGIKVVSDENASCDVEGDGRYMYVNLRPAKEGEESMIIQTGPSCYELIVKDCEVLKVTERFMVEAFVKYKEMTKNHS